MKRFRLVAVVIALALPAFALVAACSSDDRPPSGVGGGSSSGATPLEGGSSADGADSASDSSVSTGDAGPIVPVACNVLVPGGPVVAESTLPGNSPAAVGGTIAAGRYNLTRRDYFPLDATDQPPDAGSGLGGRLIQRTFVFDATTVNVTEAQGPSASSLTKLSGTSGYKLFGVVLALTASCPPPMTNDNVRFSVVGGELWLFPGTGLRDIYTLQ